MLIIDGIIRVVSENPGSAAQISFSAVLALATVAYTVATFWQIDEMQTDREVRNRPLVKPTIENRYAIHHFFAIENTGEGTAYDLTAEWGTDDETSHTWKIPLLSPGERRTFPLPFEDENGNEVSTRGQLEDVAGEDAIIEFRAWYEDSLGNTYSPEETTDVAEESMDVLDTIVAREEASEYADKDPIDDIADEMEEVTDQLETIGESIQMEYIDERAREEIHERILNEIREEAPITFKELKDGLGVKQRLLAGMLWKMLEVGQIDYDEEYAGYFFKNAMDVEIEYVGGAEGM